MARTKTKTVKADFIEVIEASLRLYRAVVLFTRHDYDAIHYNPLHPSQARQIISLAYLNIISSWESFLQEIFISYLTGAKSVNGYQPKLRIGKCKSIQHTCDVLYGRDGIDSKEIFMSWTSYENVIKRAKVYFDRGEPFSKVHDRYKQRIRDGIILRNRVAHKSVKCIEEFKKASRTFLSLQDNEKMKPGYSVGHLLIEKNIRGFGNQIKNNSDDIFIVYCNMFLEISEVIAPGRIILSNGKIG